MKSSEINDKIRTLHWRVYCQLVRDAVDNEIQINEEDLVWAVVELPEHYKINALILYTANIQPLSLESKSKILASIERSASESYVKHMKDLVSQVSFKSE